ncbi:MAG TPA: glycoside hydrolase, partial [Mucilaginibacter sp.]
WEAPLLADDKEPVYGYVIYRFEGTEKIDLGDPKNILHIEYSTNLFYDDKAIQKGKTYSYVITAIDRLKNESDRSPTMAVTIP